MRNQAISRVREGLHRQISLWMMVWSLFALIGCPFWCDTTQDSPFSPPAFGLSARSSLRPTALTPSARARAVTARPASLPRNHSFRASFDFDEFCQCACQHLALPASPSSFLAPFIAVTVNPRPIVLESAIYGRAGPEDVGTLRSALRHSSLLGRAPPLSV